ncbi:MAG: glycosyltransferase family 4 protein [Anaerolineales bacterium]|nr:glycosyltransferase family 4 protein [Chloroflexota bacterium]MBL6982589.1 glycosyltransferase family 4 protein [Anaerolineales bacterium]
MKIAIEALGIHDYGGGRTATLNLLHNLLEIGQDNQYLVILSAPEPELVARNLQQWIAPTQNRFLMRIWVQLVFPLKLRNYDLIHFAKNLSVFGLPTPALVTIYDMTTLIFPELFPKSDVWYWQYLQKYSLRSVERIIAISETTRRDIQTYYGVDPEKISVIYPSIHPRFQPAPFEHIQRARARYNLPDDYILHVGRIDRKNNIALLIEAFAHFLQHIDPAYDGSLVIVGGEYAKSPDHRLSEIITRNNLFKRIIFTDRVPNSDLPSIYSGAQVAVVTSHHEGFGLAAVEAMACETPLIANRKGAIPEVVGDAAMLLENPNPESLANAMFEVISSRSLQKHLKKLGRDRAKRFQTKTDARKTLEVYKDMISGRRT